MPVLEESVCELSISSFEVSVVFVVPSVEVSFVVSSVAALLLSDPLSEVELVEALDAPEEPLEPDELPEELLELASELDELLEDELEDELLLDDELLEELLAEVADELLSSLFFFTISANP